MVKILTRGLCASHRLTLLIALDSVHSNEILGLGSQSSQSVMSPARRKSLVLGAPAVRFLMADPITRDTSGWSLPVNGERIGLNVRKVQSSW